MDCCSIGGRPLSSCDRNNTKDRPWLTPAEQVAHLKLKGVRFELMSEAKATDYLIRDSNYFRLRAYRTEYCMQLVPSFYERGTAPLRGAVPAFHDTGTGRQFQ